MTSYTLVASLYFLILPTLLIATDPRADLIRSRAIGATYNPAVEGRQNYVDTVWPERYDAFIFIKKTNTLRPL